MGSRTLRLGAASTFAAMIVLVAGAASADPTASDRETARGLMADGDTKHEAGNLKGALKSYEAADTIMHVPTTTLAVGRTQAEIGRLLEARQTLARIAQMPARPNERAPLVEARREADALSQALERRIPRLTIVVEADGDQTYRVLLDGMVAPSKELALLQVNPGAHAVVARTSDGVEVSASTVLAEGETKLVTLDLRPPPPTPPPPPPPRPTSSPLKTALTFGGFGVGGAGVLVGSITGVISLTRVNTLKQGCTGDVCPPDKQADIDAAQSLGNVSTIAFAVGAVGVGAGIVGLLIGTGAPTKVQAVATPSWVGLAGQF